MQVYPNSYHFVHIPYSEAIIAGCVFMLNGETRETQPQKKYAISRIIVLMKYSLGKRSMCSMLQRC